MTEQNEPPLEAILASIRNILEDDDEENTPAEAAPEEKKAEESKPEPVAADVKEAPSEPEPQPEPEPVSEPEPEPQPAPVVEVAEAPAPVEASDKKPADDILNLTEEMIVADPSAVKETAPLPVEPVNPPEEEEDDFTPEPVIPQEPMKEETLTDLIKENAAKQFSDDMLLAEPTVMAATESLSHLRDIATEKQLSLGNGALTIEGIVRETLKPYLKEWLDANLPDIVERVVRKEVAHIMDRLDLK